MAKPGDPNLHTTRLLPLAKRTVLCDNCLFKNDQSSKEHPPRVTNREAGQATRSELAQHPVAAHHHHLASYSRHHLDSTRSLHHVLFSLISTDNKQNLKTWMNKRGWVGFLLEQIFCEMITTTNVRSVLGICILRFKLSSGSLSGSH